MVPAKQIVLGADAGTHGIRILAIDLSDFQVVAQSSSIYTRTIGENIQELDADNLEQAFFTALQNLVLPPDADIVGLGITHQRGTVIPVDINCHPLASALCDSDERTLDADGYQKSGVDPDAYYHRSGCPVVSFNGFSKILWCRKHWPEIYKQAAAWLSPQDYILSRLAGRLVMTEGSALRTGILDINCRRFYGDLLPDAPFLKENCIPLGASCGNVSPDIAVAWPMLLNTKLFAVPGDQPAAVLGTGVVDGVAMAMNLGTTFVASVLSKRPMIDPHGLITTEVLPFGFYSPEFGTGVGGQFMDFLTKLLYGKTPEDAETWAELDRAAAQIPLGAEGLRIVPLLWQVTSAGVDGCIHGLRPYHTREHMLRAAYEGLAYEARISIEKLTGTKQSPSRLLVFGGLSSCDCFLQILASVTGKTVEASGQKQASAFGAGLTCAIGLDRICTMGDILPRIPMPRCRFQPEREEQIKYEQEYQRYRAQR